MTIIENIEALMKCNEDDLKQLFEDLKSDIEHKFLTVEDGNEACYLLQVLRNICIIEKEATLDMKEINRIITRLNNKLDTIIDIRDTIFGD